MPEPTILEYKAVTDDLVSKLGQALSLIKTFESETGKETTLKIDIEKVIGQLSLANKILSDLQLNASKALKVGISADFQKQLDSLIEKSDRLGIRFSAFAEKASFELNPLVQKIGELNNSLLQTIVSVNKSREAGDYSKARTEIQGLLNQYKSLGSEVEQEGSHIDGLLRLYNNFGSNARASLSLVTRELKTLKEGSESTATSLSNKLGGLESILLQLRVAAVKSKEGLLESKSGYVEISRQLDVIAPKIVSIAKNTPEVAQRFQTLRNAVNGSLTSVNSDLNKFQKEADKAAKAAAKSIQDASKNIESSKTPVKSFTDSLFSLSNVIKAVIFSRIFREIKDVATVSVEASTELEALHNSFVAIIGDSGEADRVLGRLRDTADTFGKKFLDVTENYLRFRIAGDAANLTAESTDAIFNSIIVSSAALNQSTSQLNRTITAFEQILSKGVLSAEEIRRQLGNNLPGAFSLTARAIGVSNAELEKLLRSGSLLSKDVVPKIAEELLKTFSGAAIANVSSGRAEFGRFSNTVLDLKKAIGDGLLPVVIDLIRELTELKEGTDLNEITEDAHQIAVALKSVVDILIGITTLDPGKIIGASLEAGISEISKTQEVLTEVAAKIISVFSESAGQKVLQAYQTHKENINEVIESIKLWIGATKTAGDVAVEHNTRAAKAVDEVQKALEKLRNRGSSDLEGFNQDLDKSKGKVGQLAKALNEVEDGLTDIEQQTKKTWSVDIVAQTQYATRLEEIKIDAKQAGLFTGELATQIGALEQRFTPAALAAGQLNAQLKELGIKSPEYIHTSIDALNEYLDTFKDSGKITREQADLIVKSIKDILEAIRKLPQGQREAFVDLEKSLESVQSKYSKFTTEAAKEAEKLRKETARAFEGLSDEIGKIFDQLKEKISGQDIYGAADDLKKLKEEFADLQKKSNEGPLNIEELNRFNQLSGELLQRQQNAGDAIREVFDSAKQDIGKAFEELILKNDKLIEGVARLSPAAQQAFISLVQGFDELATHSKVSELDLEDFGKKLSEIFKQSGVDINGFVASLSATATLTDKLRAQILDAQKEIDSSNKSKTGEDKPSTAVDNTQAVASIDEVKKTAGELSDIWVEQNGVLQGLRSQTDDSSKSIDELKNEYDQLRAAASSGTLSIGELQSTVKRQGDIIAEVNSRQDEYVVGSDKLVESQDQVTESVGKSASGLSELADATNKARQQLEPITDTTRILKNTTDELSDSIQISSDVNTEQATAFEKNKDAIAGLSDRQDEFNAVITTTNQEYSDTIVQVDRFGNVVEDSSKKVKDAGPKMEESMKGVTTQFETSRDVLKDIVENWLPKAQIETQKWKDIIKGTEQTIGTPV